MYRVGRIGELDVGETLLLCSSVIIALQSRSVIGRSAMANAAKLPADMDNSAQSREENFTEHQDAESIIEAWGGVECVRTVLEDHQVMSGEFWAAYSFLLEQHPDKWIAWGKEGVVGVSDSQDGLLREMKSKNLTAKDVMVEYLDTDPKAYIL